MAVPRTASPSAPAAMLVGTWRAAWPASVVGACGTGPPSEAQGCRSGILSPASAILSSGRESISPVSASWSQVVQVAYSGYRVEMVVQ